MILPSVDEDVQISSYGASEGVIDKTFLEGNMAKNIKNFQNMHL